MRSGLAKRGPANTLAEESLVSLEEVVGAASAVSSSVEAGTDGGHGRARANSSRPGAHFADEAASSASGSGCDDDHEETLEEFGRARMKLLQRRRRGRARPPGGPRAAAQQAKKPAAVPFGSSAAGHLEDQPASRAPGPCHYDPKQALWTTRDSGKADPTFKSVTPRISYNAKSVQGNPGPGAYECPEGKAVQRRHSPAKRAWVSAPSRDKAPTPCGVLQHEARPPSQQQQQASEVPLLISARRSSGDAKAPERAPHKAAGPKPGSAAEAVPSRPPTRTADAGRSAGRSVTPFSRPSTRCSAQEVTTRRGGFQARGCVKWSASQHPFWTEDSFAGRSQSVAEPTAESSFDFFWIGPEDLPTLPSGKRSFHRPGVPSSSFTSSSRRECLADSSVDHGGTPGPGHYGRAMAPGDIGCLGGSACARPPAERKPAPSFGTGTRMQEARGPTGPELGPGAYAEPSTVSPRAPSRTDGGKGAAPLGGKSARWPSAPPTSPGPGSYSGRGLTLAVAVGVPRPDGDTSFGTRADRFPESARGAKRDSSGAPQQERPGRTLWRWGCANSGKKDTSAGEGGTPAPGAYDAHSGFSAPARFSPQTEGFLGTEPRFRGRPLRHGHATPGPGAYHAQEAASALAREPRGHDFGPAAERWPVGLTVVPGSYEPDELDLELLEPDANALFLGH